MTELKPMNTPISSSKQIGKDDQRTYVDIVKYRDMIRSILYLTGSRLDIMFSVCLCTRFQSNPKNGHISVVKRLFRYLNGTRTLGLWYAKGTNIDLTSIRMAIELLHN